MCLDHLIITAEADLWHPLFSRVLLKKLDRFLGRKR